MSEMGCKLAGLLFFLSLWMPVVQAKEKTFTVVIDAGHGGKDPGSVGSLVKEKAINLAVALKLGEMISAGHEDVRVIYTRKTDVFLELNERADVANQIKANLFISIHTNSVKKGNPIGAETYTMGLATTEENLDVAKLENSVILLEDDYEQRYGGFDPNSSESYIIFEFMQNKHVEQSVFLASEIQKAFSSSKRVNRGVRQAGFLVLKATSMPSVLVELGFISNKDEQQYMMSEAGQKQLARSIYYAFTKYKSDYNRKKGGYTDLLPPPPLNVDPKIISSSPEETSKSSASQTKLSSSSGGQGNGTIVYKVQILTSDKILPANSRLLKGYKADYYQDGKLYKYTYGESSDMKNIQRTLKEVSKDFKGAFIIRTKDGKRIK
jgi:N-acetylmuramoyl-L-alanine amidase